MVDMDNPALSDVVALLSRSCDFGTEVERCVALHDFVRDTIAFGFTPDFERVTPERTLRLGIGHCNAQADLFRALLGEAGIQACLRFVELDKQVLRHAVPDIVFHLLPARLFHAVTRVRVNGTWLNTDSYIFQPEQYACQILRLERHGLSKGYGLTQDAVCDWDAVTDAFSQASGDALAEDNPVYSCLADTIRDKAGNNRCFGLHFNQLLGFVPIRLRDPVQRYLNKRLHTRACR